MHILSGNGVTRPSSRITSLVQAVLGEVINELGGWEAAVFFDGGGVNIDVDTGTWSIEDQVQHRLTFRRCSTRVNDTDETLAPATTQHLS